jgi:hypothetical protein
MRFFNWILHSRGIIWQSFADHSSFFLSKDVLHYKDSAEVVALLDDAAHRSGLDRSRVFDDFLQTAICSLSGGRMEE